MTKHNSVKTYMSTSETIGSLRIDYILALIPSIIWCLIHFGSKAAILLVTSLTSVAISTVLTNLIYNKKLVIPSLYAVFSGILFSLTLYSETKISLCIIGAFLIPIFFHLFGGEKKCVFFTPLICRELAIILVPNGINTPDNLPINSILSEAIPEESITELILGLRPGMLGSISVLTILLGALYLLFRRTVDFKAPAAYILAYIVLSFMFPAIEARAVESTIYELICSDLLFVAFFILTDYNMTPSKTSHRYIKGIILAAITFILRSPTASYNPFLLSIIVVDMLSPIFSALSLKIKIAKESRNAK